MGLKLEKTGHFVKSKSEVWTFLFFNISAIIGIVCLLSFGGTFGLAGFIAFVIFPFGMLAIRLGKAFDENLHGPNSKRMGFKQGRTNIIDILSQNDITRADQSQSPISLCWDPKKRRHYWYFDSQFYSIEESLSPDEFMIEVRKYKNKQPTHVYLMNQEESHMYKIGVTNNVSKRLSSIQTSNPNPVSLVFAGKVENPRKLEKELHRHFKSQQITREWFELSNSDIDYVKQAIGAGGDVEYDGGELDRLNQEFLNKEKPWE